MPTRIKFVWFFCSVIIVVGFIYLSFQTEVEKAEVHQAAQEKAREQKLLDRQGQIERKARRVDPVKDIRELNGQGKYMEAVEAARKASEAHPADPKVYTWWGISLNKSGSLSAAIEKFVRATQLDPTHTKAFLFWGLTLAMESRFEEAIKKYQTAVELNPEHSNAYAYWGSALTQLKRNGEAIEKLEMALELNPINSSAYEILIDTLYQSKKYDRAWDAVGRARQADVQVPEEILNRLSQAKEQPKDNQ